jgi:hypothetical protein
LVLAQIASAGPYRLPSMALSAGLIIWIAICLQHTFWNPHGTVQDCIRLLAGICLVDWLAVCSGPILLMSLSMLLLAALLYQRFSATT